MVAVVVEEQRGTAGALHALDPFADHRHAVSDAAVRIWVCSVVRPAIVLGSSQAPGLLDAAACAEAGLEVVRRRSGGGAVLLRPDAAIWLDLVLPHGVAPDDIRGSMVWVGHCWIDALVALGAPPDRLRLHAAGMVTTPWSGLVCFAGTGPGEVLVGERKLVGLSQRRTRHGVRIQCQVHRRGLLGEMPRLFAVDLPMAPLAEPATLGDIGLGDLADDVVAATLADAIAHRTSPS